MKTAKEVCNKIKWDPKLNENNFIVGYEDRFEGILEMPLKDFQKSEIPFHRIRYFKASGKIVWDRENKIDEM